MQNKKQTEQEKYYARKNERREWWRGFWKELFEVIGMFLLGATIVAVLLGIIFTINQVWKSKAELIRIKEQVRTLENREECTTCKWIMEERNRSNIRTWEWLHPTPTNYIGTYIVTNFNWK